MLAKDPPSRRKPIRSIRLAGVRHNNLKNITVEFPFRKFTVVTGLSGSGKSSLVFDTLFAEGQRRYIESLSTYTRQFLEKMPKPEVDHVENVPPAIALEQRNPVLSSRSSVGTQTEIVDYLRLLFARVGTTECRECGSLVRKIDPESILTEASTWLPGRKAAILAPLSFGARAEAQKPEPKKGARKKAAAKKPAKARAGSPVSAESLLSVLREQGMRRLVVFKGGRKGAARGEALDLDDVEPAMAAEALAPALAKGEVFVMVDRVKLARAPDSETRTRLLDSIEQAARIGHGAVALCDLESWEWRAFDCRFACVKCATEHRVPEPNLFSFNSPIGACPRCSGFGHTLEIDERLVVPDPTKTLKNGAIDPFAKPSNADWQRDLFKFAEAHGISIGKRYNQLTPKEKDLLWKGDPEDDTFPGVLKCFDELARWKYKLHIRVFIRRYQSQNVCPNCHGARLQPEALLVKVGGLTISGVLAKTVADAVSWVESLKLERAQKEIARDIVAQVSRRLGLLNAVGVGYLTLDRLAKTLSGGEFQRINLATQLGNGLCGTLYVLDEPSIGLHAADTARLIRVLQDLRDQGNTVVVVEHDMETMRAADWLIELGPGAGRRGGELVASGSPGDLGANSASLTGRYLSGALRLESSRAPRGEPRRHIRITGCREHNLKNLDVEFPLDRLVVVTGVSGSGKSTLVHKTLANALTRLKAGRDGLTAAQAASLPGEFDRIYGAEHIGGIVLLDQRPIGRSSRSNPATYLKAWDEIRRLYANQVLSLRRGYTPQHFSFNVDGGRCPVCKGEGEITLDMHFMAEVKLPCEECEGKRFKKNLLDIAYRGKNISQLLHTTIDEAYDLFRDNQVLLRKLGVLRDVGLGYLLLGQSATTLSGGESQRLKIAAALEERLLDHILYVFDEPTTGLHMEDIRKLMDVVHDLIDARHSVVMIEHHLDVIAQADWVIDLGPGGGEAGGAVVAAGPPGALVANPKSVTGRMLESSGYVFPSRRG